MENFTFGGKTTNLPFRMSNWVKKTAKMNRTLAFLKTKSVPGGYTWEFLVGQCRHVLQFLTLFHTKKCHFSHPFSDPASKIHTHSSDLAFMKLCHHYLD